MRVAELLVPVVRDLLGQLPIEVRFWDDSSIGPPGRTRVVVHSARALRRLLYAPGELGIGRAYVAGDLDVEGDIYQVLELQRLLDEGDRDGKLRLGARGLAALASAAWRLGALGRPVPPPPEEVRLRGRLHSKARDAAAISHHYDVSNDFYRLVLGPTMTYSCAYFRDEDTVLDDAQEAKYELVCRKLGLREGMRLLDVGCGWGGMPIHAARDHGVSAVGVTLSREQHELASKRVAEAGLSDRVEIRYQDYREIDDAPYDAISSIGMFEHVGLARLHEYFERLADLLPPRGRLLNHAISRPSPTEPSFEGRSFIQRYVFPDGELHEVGAVVSGIQRTALEVRDVQSLREHYAKTLRAWVANLEGSWDEAVSVVGEGRARVWRLYMAASALNFEVGKASIHQVLAVKPDADGVSGVPLTRAGWTDW